MANHRYKLISLGFVLLLLLGGYFVYASEQAYLELEARQQAGEEVEASGLAWFPFQLGLDLRGGAHLVYEADVRDIDDPRERDERMNALRSLIERRVDGLGVAEPLVQVERGGVTGAGEYRLIVELPGVTDIDEAIAAIGETPILEFRLVDETVAPEGLELDLESGPEGVDDQEVVVEPEEDDLESIEEENDINDGPAATTTDLGARYQWTGLDGSMLTSARFEMRQTPPPEPVVAIRFNAEGAAMFREITRDNVGRQLAIILDGAPISEPVIREQIRGNEATISGNFTAPEARELAQRLQAGALPVNIELISTQTIGPTLGEEVLEAGLVAGVTGLVLVAVFLLLWYRLPGLLAVVALAVYMVIMLSLFKLIPVTLTAAGIAGFILSIGMAVDANVLIFERMKEELRRGRSLEEAITNGFARAWLSIRDGNFSSMITAVILYWFGTPLVQGFALVFFIGVLVSMLTAITVTRSFLLAVSGGDNKLQRLFFGSGLHTGEVLESGQDVSEQQA